MILCIDTALEFCGISLCWDGKAIDAIDNRESLRASEVLHPMIDELLKRNKLSTEDLRAVAINGGPGSYTGLRIGASAAKGLCYGLNLPLIHIGCLELMTEGIINREGKGEYQYYVPMIDARRDEVFTAVYDREMNILMDPCPMILNKNSLSDYVNGNTIFFGSGADKARELMYSTDYNTFIKFINFADDFKKIVWKHWRENDFVDVVNYTPSYLKKFHFTKSKRSS